MARVISNERRLETKRIKRPGVISKCKTSNSKNSRLYKKAYRGQGRA